MLEIRCISVLYLLVTSDAGFITKDVCLGDSVKVFETVTFTSQDTVVSLYMNHQMHTFIAQWHMQNSTIKPHIQPEYKEKVYLDEHGNIWIRNVNHWDEESYFIESGINSSYVQDEVKLNIKVAPTKNCKPKITHLDKFLVAHLEAEDCGIPVASLQWLDSPGLSNTSGSVINLPPGKEAGIYYACVKGPALECVKISMPSDYCSSYTIGENDSPTLASDILDLKTAIYVTVIVPSTIVIGSVVLVIVALHLIPKIWRRILQTDTTLQAIDAKISDIIQILPKKETADATVQTDTTLQAIDAKISDIIQILPKKETADATVQTDTTLQAIDAKISEKSNSQLQRRGKKRISDIIQILPKKETADATVQTDTTLQAIDAKISEKSNSQLQRRGKKRISANIQFIDPREDNTDGTDPFRETDLSDMQSISIDEQKANPEGDKAQPESVESFGVLLKEDSNSDEECKKPLIVVHGDQNPKAVVTFYDV